MTAYTDADYRDIDYTAYKATNNSYYNPRKYKDAHVVTKTTKTTYKVIDQHENKANGFKAYAVAPIKGKKPDYNNVVVSFAGTDGAGSINDVLTDIETIGLGRNKYIEPKVNQNIMKIAKWTSSPAVAALSVSFQDASGQYHESIVGEDELNVFVGWQITRAKLITRWDDNE